MKTLNTFLGCFLLSILLSGCGVRHVKELLQNEPLQNTAPVGDKQETPKEDFIPGFHPFKDDPDNPSPHNPLVRKFGDIPEVRTYIRLKQKFEHGIGLNIDEAIELHTAEAYLYPTDAAKANLKQWKKDKERYERLGIPEDEPVFSDIIDPEANASDENPAVNEEAD
jgi:hypothetical protein